MVNDCLGTLVELMLERIEKLEYKVEELEKERSTWVAEGLPTSIFFKQGDAHDTAQTDVD